MSKYLRDSINDLDTIKIDDLSIAEQINDTDYLMIDQPDQERKASIGDMKDYILNRYKPTYTGNFVSFYSLHITESCIPSDATFALYDLFLTPEDVEGKVLDIGFSAVDSKIHCQVALRIVLLGFEENTPYYLNMKVRMWNSSTETDVNPHAVFFMIQALKNKDEYNNIKYEFKNTLPSDVAGPFTVAESDMTSLTGRAVRDYIPAGKSMEVNFILNGTYIFNQYNLTVSDTEYITGQWMSKVI